MMLNQHCYNGDIRLMMTSPPK